ncbi:hypothetical protein [Paracoccus sp. R86501]|uniref:hypothetical protein n=1 Tax=Paracoccus sp. R86501 TaxID=3101711 RepID=UPI00366BF188
MRFSDLVLLRAAFSMSKCWKFAQFDGPGSFHLLLNFIDLSLGCLMLELGQETHLPALLRSPDAFRRGHGQGLLLVLCYCLAEL